MGLIWRPGGRTEMMDNFDKVLALAFDQDKHGDLAFSIIREKCDAAHFDVDAAKLMLEPFDYGCECEYGDPTLSKKTWKLLSEFYCSFLTDIMNSQAKEK